MRLLICLALSALGCAEQVSDQSYTSCEHFEVLAALSDYTSTMVGGLGPESFSGIASIDFGRDPMLRSSGGDAFFVNRYDGTIFSLDTSCGQTRWKGKLLVSPSQEAWNPQDVARAYDGSLWVPFYNRPVLRVLPEGAGDGDPRVLDISLSGYDYDENPNAASAITVSTGGTQKVFVSLGRLDDFSYPRVAPKAPGLLLKFDVKSRAVESAYELVAWNPFGPIVETSGLLLLAMAGDPFSSSEQLAGVEVFDPVSETSRLITSEIELGGSVSQLAINGECGAAIIFGPEEGVNPTQLVSFLAPTSTDDIRTSGAIVARGILSTEGFDLSGLAWQGNTLYVGDRRRFQAGYRVHKLTRNGSCTLVPSGVVVVPQMPSVLIAASIH